jgi:hypothetical protein
MLVLVLACSEYELGKEDNQGGGEPDIEVTPLELVFPVTAPGCEETWNLSIANKGTRDLTVSGIELLGDPTITTQPLSVVLAPDQRELLPVRFAPIEAGDYTGVLTVSSDDPDEPVVEVLIEGPSGRLAEQQDTFTQAQSDIDVLWVIDNSSSMTQEQSRVAAAINSFFQYFVTLSLDYHMGVITSDVVTPSMGGRLQGSPTFITPTTSAAADELAEAINVGEEDMGDESGLYAAELALSEPVLSAENAGFYRPDAHLAVIFLSDEPEQSGYTDTHFTEFFSALKSDDSLIHISSIVGDPATGCAATCDGVENTATPGDAYYNVTQAFGGVFYSICNCDIAPGLEQIGAISTAWLSTFTLSQIPEDPSAIQVTVDGVDASGWSYDATSNSISFSVPPIEGASIVISYQVLAGC